MIACVDIFHHVVEIGGYIVNCVDCPQRFLRLHLVLHFSRATNLFEVARLLQIIWLATRSNRDKILKHYLIIFPFIHCIREFWSLPTSIIILISILIVIIQLCHLSINLTDCTLPFVLRMAWALRMVTSASILKIKIFPIIQIILSKSKILFWLCLLFKRFSTLIELLGKLGS